MILLFLKLAKKKKKDGIIEAWSQNLTVWDVHSIPHVEYLLY